MNKTILMGRLTRDPEVRPSEKTTIARFSLAVDRRFKREGEADADFFDCTAFGRQAEFVEKYLHQGTKVLVTGRLQNNNYTNKDGQKVYGVQIITEEIEFAESKQRDQTQTQTQPMQPYGGYQMQAPPTAAAPPQPQGGYQQTAPIPQPQGGYQQTAPAPQGYQQTTTPAPAPQGYQQTPAYQGFMEADEENLPFG